MRCLGYFLFFLLLGNSLSCITEFNPGLTKDLPKLVVDGMITDRPGPYAIRITYSAPYNNDKSIFGRSPAQAAVSIRDDAGNSETLHYTANGYFNSSASGMRGMVGRSYVLSIVLPDGRRYESRPELLAPTPEIDTVYTQFEELTGLQLGKHKVLLDVSDPQSEENYYRWTWAHYEVRTLCKVTYEYPLGMEGGPPIRTAWSCCDSCWTVARCEGCINISSDKLINGHKIVGQIVTEVPFFFNTLDPYFILIQQQSLSKSAYLFWSKARSQLANSGGIFDTPPVPIQGNMYNVNDADEQVLGYFGASAIRFHPYFLNRFRTGAPPNDHLPKEGPKRSCKPCEESYLTTAVRPIGWRD